MCFSAYFFSQNHTFRLCTCRCFRFVFACFPSEKHTTCVFLLASSLKNTLFTPLHIDQLPVCVFSLAFLLKNTRHVVFRSLLLLKSTLFTPLHIDQLPGCVFSLAFLLKNTRHVLFCSLLLSKTHFSLHYIPISFRFVFSCLLFF